MSDTDHLEKAKQCLIKRTPDSKYRSNCSTGYKPSFVWLWEAHHIIPISALKSKHIKAADYEEYIEACLCITNWDINASDNLIGLDTKWPYYYNNAVLTISLPDNLPSHRIDHDLYLEEIYQWMEKNIWNKLKKARDKHKLDPKSIAEELKAGSQLFRSELEMRGSHVGGTKWCWNHRFDQGMENVWYIPFSMGIVPRKRHPGALATTWLERVFESIK